MKSRPHVLILNAALQGRRGNTGQVLRILARHLKRSAQVKWIHLADHPDVVETLNQIDRTDGLVLGTGTHWDSWSSLCQAFLEQATVSEGTSIWLGKPAAVLVTEHSVGGKGVLSRLQGVLSSYGCLIPPMSGLVYSLTGQNTHAHQLVGANDVWGLADLQVMADNLLLATHLRPPTAWNSWSVDRKEFKQRWVNTSPSA